VYDFEAELRLVIKQRCRDQVPASLRSRIADTLAVQAPLPNDGAEARD